MFLHRRPLARFRRQEAEPAIYLQPYIPDDLGELAASEMPQLGSTQGLLDMMGGGSSAEEEGGPPRKQRRLEETAPGAPSPARGSRRGNCARRGGPSLEPRVSAIEPGVGAALTVLHRLFSCTRDHYHTWSTKAN